MTFIPDLKYLKAKCNRTLQLLRAIVRTEYGADRKTLLKLYRSLIRSKLDYGNFIYQSTRKTYQKIINQTYHGGLRLVLGAFKTSPVESLYAEANEALIRSNKLALQYYVKLKSCPSNPAFHSKYRELFERSERAIKPFSLRMERIKEARMNLTKNTQ